MSATRRKNGILVLQQTSNVGSSGSTRAATKNAANNNTRRATTLLRVDRSSMWGGTSNFFNPYKKKRYLQQDDLFPTSPSSAGGLGDAESSEDEFPPKPSRTSSTRSKNLERMTSEIQEQDGMKKNSTSSSRAREETSTKPTSKSSRYSQCRQQSSKTSSNKRSNSKTTPTAAEKQFSRKFGNRHGTVILAGSNGVMVETEHSGNCSTVHELAKRVNAKRPRRSGLVSNLYDAAHADRLLIRNECESFITNIVCSRVFDAFIGLLLLLNAFVMGYEHQKFPQHHVAGTASDSDNDDTAFRVLDMIFLGLFTMELVMRYVAVGKQMKHFTKWMWFDVAIVIIGFLTEVLVPLMEEFNEKNSEYVSMAKALRCFRIIRMFSMIEHLWTVALTFQFAVQSLFWTVIFLVIVVFIFAMFVVALVKQPPPEYFDGLLHDADPIFEREFYRTLPAMLALFEIMTLDNWVETTKAIVEATEKPVIMTCFFCLFLSILALLVMNMITAVVFTSASQRAVEEQNPFVYKMVMHKARFDAIFDAFEENRVGAVLEQHQFWGVITSAPEIFQQALGYLGILCESDALSLLFPLLDIANDGCIRKMDFIRVLVVIEALSEDPVAVALVQAGENLASKKFFLARALLQQDPGLRLRWDEAQLQGTLQQALQQSGLQGSAGGGGGRGSGNSFFQYGSEVINVNEANKRTFSAKRSSTSNLGGALSARSTSSARVHPLSPKSMWEVEGSENNPALVAREEREIKKKVVNVKNCLEDEESRAVVEQIKILATDVVRNNENETDRAEVDTETLEAQQYEQTKQAEVAVILATKKEILPEFITTEEYKDETTPVCEVKDQQEHQVPSSSS
ncbi:unnamed protein product [Amoebophrya sp. A25]|nr:unnamed protein product [Amoebophrya sp. A25]|eukprot:GSA25T00019792001.1